MSQGRGRRRLLATAPKSAALGPAARQPAAAPSTPQRGSGLLLVGLALLGMALAGYLTTVHYAHVPLACSSSGVVDCQLVLSSAYSVVPGTSLPITVPGMLYFLATLAVALAQLRRPLEPRLRQLQVGLAGLGLLAALYLIFVELIELGTICLWCTSVHVVILLTLLTAIWRLHPPAASPTRD